MTQFTIYVPTKYQNFLSTVVFLNGVRRLKMAQIG